MSEQATMTPTVTPTIGLVQFDHGGETVKYYNNSALELPAGTPIVQGNLFGVPWRPILPYSEGALAIEGAMLFPKSGTDAGLVAGADAYWDSVNSVATSTVSGNTWIGKVEHGMGTNGVPGAIATADTIVYVQVEAVNAVWGSTYGAILAGGVAQDIFTASATQNYNVGAIHDTPDGRRFRYAKAGGVNITRTLMQQAAAAETHFIDVTQTGHRRPSDPRPSRPSAPPDPRTLRAISTAAN